MTPTLADPFAYAPPHLFDAFDGCAWWNLVCQGGSKIADSGMSSITKSIATGAEAMLSEITKIIDESTTVPLADDRYRAIYFGFVGLAIPFIAVILFAAVILSAIRRDPATLIRAVTGLVVATLGGALYIAFAQFLIELDDWLSHGIVAITGQSLTDGIGGLTVGFSQIAGAPGEVAANMMLIILMMIMLVAGVVLWFVLVLRQIAILVVVAFAPLLIVGWLWAPTRPWVRRCTEVVVALIFTKTALYALFGIGMTMLFRDGGQSLSDFVGAVVLLCGACFAPLMMLKLVHFAADSHMAGEMMGTLRGGMQPILRRVPNAASMTQTMGRHDMARSHSNAPRPEPAYAGEISPGPTATGGKFGGSGGAAAGSSGSSGGSGSGAAGGALAAMAVATTVDKVSSSGPTSANRLSEIAGSTRAASTDSIQPARLSGPSMSDGPADGDGS